MDEADKKDDETFNGERPARRSFVKTHANPPSALLIRSIPPTKLEPPSRVLETQLGRNPPNVCLKKNVTKLSAWDTRAYIL